jgi:hypothetical protein
MQALGITRRVGLATPTQIFLLLLVARSAILPLCLGFDDILADGVISALQSITGGLDEKQDGSVLAALDLGKECSNELQECQKPGTLPDFTNLQCFSICIAI